MKIGTDKAERAANVALLDGIRRVVSANSMIQ